MRYRLIATTLLAALWVGACDNKIADPLPGETAMIRLVHGAASPGALDLRVDGAAVLASVAATQISSYAEVAAGTRTVSVTLAGSSQVLLTRQISLAADGEYTVLVSGTPGSPEWMIASDTAFIPLAGKAKIRVLHAARQAPPLDVYLTTPGADLATSFKLVEPFAFNVNDTAYFPGFAERDPGDWQMRFTADGTTDVVLDTGPFAAGAGKVITVILSHDGGNALVARIVDETPGTTPQRVAIRVNHAAPAVPNVALHLTDPGADLNLPHLTISPFNYGVDSSTVTFMLPPNNQNSLDFEVRFTEIGTLNLLASSGAVSAPVNASKLVTLRPAQGGGLEVIVTDAP